METKTKVGLIGTGNIAPAYVRGCRDFDILDVVACTDLDMDRATAFADEHEMKAMTIDEMLADPDIEIVVNLTVPAAHAEVSIKALEAGKNVHSEKPFALTREDGLKIMDVAEKTGKRVGCAPDTFLGGGGQTVRKIIDDGWIGEPVAATAFLLGHGMEHWHPNPTFFYQFGGGPVFDMGPYYVTALVHLLGPVSRVAGVGRISFPQRTITSQPLYGQKIDVEVPTHMTALLDFESGVVGTMITSFDVWAHGLPRIEIYGSEGSVSVPDPNTFRGPVRVWTVKDQEWREVSLMFSDKVSRGIGVADMAYALRSGRQHRANGEMAMHALDIMQAFGESSDAGKHIEIGTRMERPAPLPLGLREGVLDE